MIKRYEASAKESAYKGAEFICTYFDQRAEGRLKLCRVKCHMTQPLSRHTERELH